MADSENRVLAERYELRGLLGKGAMGQVRLAFDRRLRREVAVKSLHGTLAVDQTHLDRFEREAEALALVRHRGIVSVYDLVREDGGLHIVLEYVPGRALSDELRAGALPWDRVAHLGAEVCDALSAAHAKGIVHRDLKPANLLLDAEDYGRVRVADFGVASLADADRMTRSGASIGTPGYWSPEQARGHAATPRSDLYSLGVILFEAATGRRPFEAEEGGDASFMALAEPAPDARRFEPRLSEDASRILAWTLATAPEDRPTSAAELGATLREASLAPPAISGRSAGGLDRTVTDGAPASTLVDEDPAKDPTAPARRTRGRGLVPVAIAVAAGCLVGAGLLFATRGPAEARAGTQRMGANGVSLAVPSSWRPTPGVLPDLAFTGPAIRRADPGSGVLLEAGLVDGADGPRLLPNDLADRLRGDVDPQPVRLGATEALRYRGVNVRGLVGRRATIFVAPTGAGVVTVACTAPDGAARLAPCESVAASLRLRGLRAFPVTPSAAFAGRLDGVLGRLSGSRFSVRARLASAATPEAQAAAASELAGAYRAARGRLGDITDLGPAGRPLIAELVKTLGRTERSYRALSRAAGAGDAGAYATANASVERNEAAVWAAVRSFAVLGYPSG